MVKPHEGIRLVFSYNIVYLLHLLIEYLMS